MGIKNANDQLKFATGLRLHWCFGAGVAQPQVVRPPSETRATPVEGKGQFLNIHWLFFFFFFALTFGARAPLG